MKTVEQSDLSHFQLEGTWTLSSGKPVHFVALKQTRDSVMDMANVYLNIEDVRPSVQGDFEEDTREGLHINIIDLVMEHPTCEVVHDLFRYFLSNTSPGDTVRVPGPRHRGRLKTCTDLKQEAKGCPLVPPGPHELLTDGVCKEGSENQSQHKAESSDLNTIECTSCPLKFGNKRELLNHVKSEHRTRNRTHFKCDKCQRTFSSNKTKLAHLREAHRDSRPKTKVEPRPASLMCPTCGEKKNSEYNLSQHIKKFHENAFPEPVVCHLCTETKQLRNRKYHTPYSFELHMRQIHRFVNFLLLNSELDGGCLSLFCFLCFWLQRVQRTGDCNMTFLNHTPYKLAPFTAAVTCLKIG